MRLIVFSLIASLVQAQEHVHVRAQQGKRRADLPDAGPDFWRNVAKKQLEDILNYKPINKRAKNVIIFLGDGMGISTVTAGRIHVGQQQGKTGEEHMLTFDKFPNIALSKTYNTDHMVPDSAGTATAVFTGVKTILAGIGIDGRTERGNCESQLGKEVDSILDWSLAAGKKVGLVTTTRVTHATPASLYSHVADRDWEAPMRTSPDLAILLNGTCRDIARQLVEDKYDIHVVLGGGRRMFFPNTTEDRQNSTLRGSRVDGRDLLTEWEATQQKKGRKSKFVSDVTEFRNLDTANIDYLLGLLAYDHLDFEVDRKNAGGTGLSLTEMTKAAIKILQKSQEKGFFLMVEGGRIDHGHHDSNAIEAMWDMLAFDDAIKTTLEMVNLEETLIIVTADHSHTFTIGGYPDRGAPILGLSLEDGGLLAGDKMTFTILSYANGATNERRNVSQEEAMARSYKQPSLVNLRMESHGGEDVGIFANGPMAHLFRGVVEQNYITYVAAYASCVGPYANNCTDIPKCTDCNDASRVSSPFTHLLGICLIWITIRLF